MPASVVELLVLLINLPPQVGNLLIQSALLMNFAILEILYNVELMFLEHVVVCVKLFIFFGQGLLLGLRFKPRAFVRLYLLRHLFESSSFELFILLKFFKLLCLLLDRILQSLDAEGRLSLGMVFRRFDLLHFF